MTGMMRRDAIKRTAPEHPAPAESPAVVDGIAAGVGLGTSCCEHSLRWHHQERGCGYHGYSKDRCPCPLPFDEALAAHVATARAEALREAAEAWPVGVCAHRCFREDEHIAPKDCLYGPDWLKARADREAQS